MQIHRKLSSVVLIFRWHCRSNAQESTGSLRGLVRQLSIDQFENEGRRVMGAESAAKPDADGRPTPIFERHSMDPGSIHKVCSSLGLSRLHGVEDVQKPLS